MPHSCRVAVRSTQVSPSQPMPCELRHELLLDYRTQLRRWQATRKVKRGSPDSEPNAGYATLSLVGWLARDQYSVGSGWAFVSAGSKGIPGKRGHCHARDGYFLHALRISHHDD